MNNLQIIILAAGRGSRMKSQKPKVLHHIAGKPMIEHIINTSKQLTKDISIIYGYGGDKLQQHLANENLNWIYQAQQNGTGAALQLALPHIDKNKTTLILYGDVPFISKTTLANLIQSDFNILTAKFDNPTGYGRIVRANGNIQKIVEQKDASENEKQITEVNTGIMAVRGHLLHKYLPQLTNDNVQKEYYLTDIIAKATNDNIQIASHLAPNNMEITGINDKSQLADLERKYQVSQAQKMCKDGLQIIDITRFDLRGSLEFGLDCTIDINTIFKGKNSIGNNTQIGANCIIKDSTIGDNVNILPNSIIEDSTIGNGVNIGPFARVRPQTQLQDNTKIGNFVETKKSIIGENSKVNHLSYVGDSEVGKNVNIGAGVITCNYDGVNKHQTKIDDNSFIGSNSALVAPITIGKNSLVGAGSVITKNIDDNQIAIGRSKQKNIDKKSK
jgi:bifunctional UDP-N-acetylglucosamine pyrophosphorylase/glucosamine-1-phosphate N-acetyltransferase